MPQVTDFQKSVVNHQKTKVQYPINHGALHHFSNWITMNMPSRILLFFALALASSVSTAADSRVWLSLELIEKSVEADGIPDLRSARLDVQERPSPSNKVVAVCFQKTAKNWACNFKDLQTGDIDVWRTGGGSFQASGEITIKPLSGSAVTVPFSEPLSFGKEGKADITGAGVTFVLRLKIERSTDEE